MTASRILAEKGSTVITVPPDATLAQAAAVLHREQVGAAVVAGPDGAPIGVFSERDLARVVAESGPDGLALGVADAMSRELITAEPGSTIDHLMGLMTDKRVRHVIILDQAAMAGVVSIGDVVKRKIAEAQAEAESLKAYIEGA